MEGGKSMNKVHTQTIATVRASDNFIEWVRNKLKETGTSEITLAEHCNVERKTIVAILCGKRSPKLDIVANIYNYFGETEIRIPIK